MIKFFKTYSGALILATALIFAIIRVGYNQIKYETPDVTTLRICHWQLESGFRDALQDLIDAYEQQYFERHNKKIRVLQMPISERGYGQFINTGLVGGTAPDIIELGKSKMAWNPSYIMRYFVPLSTYIDQPNPYNAGTELEGYRWRETFADGLVSSYSRTLLNYYKIPFSMFTVRIYYNKDLYREITGSDKVPATFNAFIKMCEQTEAFAEQQTLPLVPLAGSKFQANVFKERYSDIFLTEIIHASDENIDGLGSVFETYRAYCDGKWSFNSPAMQASWQCMADLAAHFQKGWMAALRDDAVFMFVQKRALMFASGSWDASSLIEQVGDAFEIGVLDFPVPTDHHEYGKFVLAMPNEAATGGGIPWTINRTTKNVDLCVDFLQFCTTRDNNAQFTSHITWLPIVQGIKLSDTLKPFKPRIKGVAGHLAYEISSEFRLRSEGDLWQLFSGSISPKEYAASLSEIYERSAVEGYKKALDDNRRNLRDMERIVAGQLFKLADPHVDDIEMIKDNIVQLLYANQSQIHDLAINRHYLETLTK